MAPCPCEPSWILRAGASACAHVVSLRRGFQDSMGGWLAVRGAGGRGVGSGLRGGGLEMTDLGSSNGLCLSPEWRQSDRLGGRNSGMAESRVGRSREIPSCCLLAPPHTHPDFTLPDGVVTMVTAVAVGFAHLVRERKFGLASLSLFVTPNRSGAIIIPYYE